MVQHHRRRAAVTHNCTCRRRHSGPERQGWGSDAPCKPCATRTGPPHASHAGGTGGCGIAAPQGTTRGTPDWCLQREVRASARCLGWGAGAHPPPPPATTMMGRGLHRARALPWCPQGVWGAHAAAMGGQRGQTPDPGRPALPSRRGTSDGWGGGGGGGGAAQPAPNCGLMNSWTWQSSRNVEMPSLAV